MNKPFTNVDPAELAKFAKLAAHWWDPKGELHTLHEINPLRLGYIEQKVALAGKKVLDVGCGGGILSESLAKQGAIVTGLDMDKTIIGVAKLHQLESKVEVEYVTQTVESLSAERPQYYDVITCMEMLEHVPEPQSVIKSCAQLLKPDGHIFFSTLNRNLKAYLFAIIGAEYVLKILPKGTHDYAKFIRPSELTNWLRAASINADDMIGITYNPLNKTFKLTTDLSVNYILHGVK